MRGGAQIWLADCGKRLSEVGHQITFILPEARELDEVEKLETRSQAPASHIEILGHLEPCASCEIDRNNQFECMLSTSIRDRTP